MNRIHITDDKALNERMNRVWNKVLTVCIEEKFTAKDLLWLAFLLEQEVQELYLSERSKTDAENG
ncbi:hypothetical protein LCGC14_2464460 [marine sediment metagenome]|uniref:Uncharacterized protein n=1 Tax=marine sediment metagenome TaxID=412755 RepID=A0A0F9BCT1_9ZZZZ